jgi:hypothetical protein
MSGNRTENQWKLHRGKAVTDDGVAAIARKHEDRAAKHQEQNEIAPTPHRQLKGWAAFHILSKMRSKD